MLAPAHLQSHAELLEELGYESSGQLVEDIRAGRHDDHIGDLARQLERDVRAKLEVADPRYLD
jgi:hypothetical protein